MPELHSPLPQHGRRSMDTNASGIAESTISFAGSLRLGSAFPYPPTDIPSGSSSRSDYSMTPPSTYKSLPAPRSIEPLTPRRKMKSPTQGIPLNAVSESSHTDIPPAYSQFSRDAPTAVGSLPTASDWADGASSIDSIDPAESRLLPTDFITSLLQNGKVDTRSPRRYQQSYVGSDAFSSISEITYPPLQRPIYPPSNIVRTAAGGSKPSGTYQAPPSSFSAGASTSASGRVSVRTTESESSTLFDAPAVRGRMSRGVSLGAAAVTNFSTTQSDPLIPPDLSGRQTPGRSSPAIPSTRTSSRHMPSTRTSSRHIRDSSGRDRQSVHSTKGSFISRISKALKKKPLPPVPFLPHLMSLSDQMEHRRVDELRPLPELIDRAGALSEALERSEEKGYNYHGYQQSHRSITSLSEVHTEQSKSMIPAFDPSNRPQSFPFAVPPSDSDRLFADDPSRQYAGSNAPFSSPPSSTKHHALLSSPRIKKIIIGAACIIIVIALVVGLVIGLIVKKKKPAYVVPSCAGSLTGASCDLDASCVCTGTGVCGELAQSLVALTPKLNQFFNLDFTPKNVSDAIWLLQGTPAGSCKTQALLVDVGPALDVFRYPNRTTFIRSAVLWNTVISQDTAALKTIQDFLAEAPWEKLEQDGPVKTGGTEFTLTVSGIQFDFAAQSVSEPQVTFITQSQATRSQISQVGDQAKTTLDRMYSYALSSSTQRQLALKNYWRSVLQLNINDLPAFLTAFGRAEIIVPFDATNSLASGMLNQSTSSIIPTSCYPGLNASAAQIFSDAEALAFNLPKLATQTRFDPNCASVRPVYGVLDVLHLRLPFADRTGVSRQGVALIADVNTRGIVRLGQVLTTLPNDAPSPNAVSSTSLNPRGYGTLGNMEHIVLSYLSAIADVNIAVALAKYIMDPQQALPPSETTLLGQSLAKLPLLEVAVFGTVRTSDIAYTSSSFATPSNGLFFGSALASRFRQWAISVGSSVRWAESATAPSIVRDSSLTDKNFNAVWDTASLALDTNAENVGVRNVTEALRTFNKFTA